MKYFILILSGLLASFHIQSQNLNFTVADPQPEIFDVYGGSILSADLDNDGDMDIVQSGLGENLTGQIAELAVFLNDGVGNFTELDQDFNDFWSTEKAFLSDIDNDNDMDLVVMAYNRTELYKNDGSANFTLVENNLFHEAGAGDISIGDVDGDGDNDIIQHGSLDLQNEFTALYLNDGTGQFTEDQNQIFQAYIIAATEFIDIENDGDLDLIVFGNNLTDINEVKLYENDGQGNFTSIDTGSLQAHSTEDVDVGDVDNDGDMDILVSGLSANSQEKTSLYLNDGNGSFTELLDTPFPNVFTNTNNLSDLDNDGDLDVLIVGSGDGGIPNIFAIVFENLGNNNYVVSDSLGGEYIPANTIADFNGDGKKDIIIQGFVDDTNVYWNETLISNVEDLSISTFTIYPNPSNGQFQLERGDTVFEFAEILNLNGQIIHRQALNLLGIQEINFNAPPGMYTLRLRTENVFKSKKILVIN